MRRQRLFFLMPLIIIAFLIAVLHRRPGDFVRRLFAAGVIAPLVFIFILIPGAVKRFFINFLRMGRQYMLNAVGEFLFTAIGHTDLLFEH